MRRLTKSLTETENLAARFVKLLKPARAATIVALSGDLGSGKTTFTQAAARVLGVADHVTSPTFVIEKIYKLPNRSQGDTLKFPKVFPWEHFTHLIHLDCYRIKEASEIVNLGWAEIVANPKNLIFIEWPERIIDILPADHQKISFEFIDETTRQINFYD